MKHKLSLDVAGKSVRLDKWLWAARFFKTRSLARAAVEGGKVGIDGVRAKPGKAVQLGLQINLRMGAERRQIIVKKLLDKRGSAVIAQTLYTETDESIARREQDAAQRKLANTVIQHDKNKPEKHQRRQMQRFKRNQ